MRQEDTIKAATLLLVIGLSVAGVGIAFPDSPPLQTLQEIMQMKLGHAQGVLEAIVLEDFEAVEAHAQQLLRLSEATTLSAPAHLAGKPTTMTAPHPAPDPPAAHPR